MFKIKKNNKIVSLDPLCDEYDAFCLAASCGGEISAGFLWIGEPPSLSVTLQMLERDGQIEAEVLHLTRHRVASFAHTAAMSVGTVSYRVGRTTVNCEHPGSGLSWEYGGAVHKSRVHNEEELSYWITVLGLRSATVGGQSPYVFVVDWEANGIRGRMYASSEERAKLLLGWIERAISLSEPFTVRAYMAPLAEVLR